MGRDLLVLEIGDFSQVLVLSQQEAFIYKIVDENIHSKQKLFLRNFFSDWLSLFSMSSFCKKEKKYFCSPNLYNKKAIRQDLKNVTIIKNNKKNTKQMSTLLFLAGFFSSYQTNCRYYFRVCSPKVPASNFCYFRTKLSSMCWKWKYILHHEIFQLTFVQDLVFLSWSILPTWLTEPSWTKGRYRVLKFCLLFYLLFIVWQYLSQLLMHRRELQHGALPRHSNPVHLHSPTVVPMLRIRAHPLNLHCTVLYAFFGSPTEIRRGFKQ